MKSMVKKLEQLYDAQAREPNASNVKLPGAVDALLRDLENNTDTDDPIDKTN